MTFKQLAQETPELINIKKAARGWRNHHDKWRQYERLKAQMSRCVGWKADKTLPEFMHTTKAYDVAHKAIFG